jgi:hypothetical protein
LEKDTLEVEKENKQSSAANEVLTQYVENLLSSSTAFKKL